MDLFVLLQRLVPPSNQLPALLTGPFPQHAGAAGAGAAGAGAVVDDGGYYYYYYYYQQPASIKF